MFIFAQPTLMVGWPQTCRVVAAPAWRYRYGGCYLAFSGINGVCLRHSAAAAPPEQKMRHEMGSNSGAPTWTSDLTNDPQSIRQESWDSRGEWLSLPLLNLSEIRALLEEPSNYLELYKSTREKHKCVIEWMLFPVFLSKPAHKRWKPFQNHLPSECRHCRVLINLRGYITVFGPWGEFFVGITLPEAMSEMQSGGTGRRPMNNS